MSALSVYGRKFDKNCKTWTDDAVFNKEYLRGVQVFYNTLLKARGYVFLRDIYEELGFEISKASIVVGWYYDTNNDFVDNYVDFGIFNQSGPDFELDFNVDGDISHHFKEN